MEKRFYSNQKTKDFYQVYNFLYTHKIFIK